MTLTPIEPESSSSPQSSPTDERGGLSRGPAGGGGAVGKRVVGDIRAIGASSVMSTMNDDGTRKWLRPRVSVGRFLTSRRTVAYALIAIFAAMPLVRLNGKPLILLDIINRKFHILGGTFYPTDTLLLALLAVCVFLTIFWTTALLGRVWCGWGCPQTVYMEFLYRPIERLLEGAPGRTGGGLIKSKAIAKPVKFVVFLVCSAVLAHIFLAYFVSWENLRHWVFGSPAEHPIGFAVVALVTAGMMFDFGYFREQVCLVACPYGRFQSVMLDRHSMVIRYDQKRGEPRGKKTSKKADVALPVLTGAPAAQGDCIDCTMCVTTCPTGIDIRNGLQMECIGCAQCIDACDAVMDKIGRARGLIRYSSQAAMEGQKFRILRPRVLLYPAVILVLATLFAVVLLNTGVADVTVLRGLGQPFASLPEGGVRNNLRVKIANRLDRPGEFSMAVEGLEGARLKGEATTVTLAPGQMQTVPVEVDVPRGAFHDGRASVMIVISGPEKFTVRRPFTLLGPSDEREEHEKKGHE